MRKFNLFYVTLIVLIFTTLVIGTEYAFAADYTFANYEGGTIEGSVGDAIHKDFSCEISVSLYVPDDETPDAAVKLYDANNNLISETPSYAVGENYYYDAEFEIPNEDKEYIIELYLVDENGNQVSDVQKWNYTFKKYEIEYGYIYEKGLSEGLNQDVVIDIRDAQGKETEYSIANLIYINNKRVNTGDFSDEELLEMIETPSYAQFVTNRDGKIKILNFDTTAQSITNTSYDKETASFENVAQSDVPVYYTPYEEGEMWEHILSENYYYELAVYDYALVITDFDSKDYDEEVITYEFSENISASFSCGISFTLNTSNETPDAAVKLYDANNNLISETPSYAVGENYYYDAEFEIPNEDKEYIIELYLVDENGNQVSDVQKWNYTFEKYEIEYGYIYEKGLSEGLNQDVVIDIRDVQGKETEYTLQNSIMWIDGQRVNCKTMSNDELLAKINTECYVEFILNKDSTIKILNFADFNEDSYAVFSYNYRDTDLIITSAHILPEEIEENALVICAFYNNGILADVKIQKAIGEKIHFHTDVTHNNIKFMVWSNLYSLIPTEGFKDIDTSLWN